MTYVATNRGQQIPTRMQSARIIAVAVMAIDGGGKISAVIIPIAAITARPTNGWRGALSNFINGLFAYPTSSRQAAIVRRNHQEFLENEQDVECRSISGTALISIRDAGNPACGWVLADNLDFLSAEGAVFTISLGHRPRIHGIQKVLALTARFTLAAPVRFTVQG